MSLDETVGVLSEEQKRNVWNSFLRRRVTPYVLRALSDVDDPGLGVKISCHYYRQLYYRALREQKPGSWSAKKNQHFVGFLDALESDCLRFIVRMDSGWRLENWFGVIERYTERNMKKAKENASRGCFLHNAYVNSKYLQDKSGRRLSLPAITASLESLLDHQPPIDGLKLGAVLSAKRASDLDEAVECALISIPNYTVIKRLGIGAIKRAYLAVNKHSGDESVFLMIDPSSKGFKHYETIYSKQLEKQGGRMADEEFHEWALQKIYTTEFSGVQLRNLEDPRYIALISPPIVGKAGDGRDVYFLETKPYDHTLEDELLGGLLPTNKILKYMYQLTLALYNCYKNGIVHKDLKPDNIGITKEGNIVLSDFGCVSMFSTAGDTRYQYPLVLRPPELAYPDEYWQNHDVWWQSDLFTPEANVWTLGAIFYRMITGENLIVGPEVRAKIGTKKYHQQNKKVYQQIHDKEGIMKKRDEIPILITPPELVEEIFDSCFSVPPNRRILALTLILSSFQINEPPGYLNQERLEQAFGL